MIAKIEGAELRILRERVEEVEEHLKEIKDLIGLGEHTLEEKLEWETFSLTVGDLKQILGKDRAQITMLCQAGYIPYARVNKGPGGGGEGQYRFRGTDVARVMPEITDLTRRARRLMKQDEGEYGPYGQVEIDESGYPLDV